ncbi:MAG: tetratricopeptide repeat protein [Polyangiaceae bacterium]
MATVPTSQKRLTSAWASRSFQSRFRAVSLAAIAAVVAAGTVNCGPRNGSKTPSPAASASASSSASTNIGKLPDEPSRPTEDHAGFPKAKKKKPAPAAKPVRVGLQGGLDAVEGSEYATAEKLLNEAQKDPKQKAQALLGLARMFLETGKLAEAIKNADEAAKIDKATKIAAVPLKARALARQGKLEDAVKVCEEVEKEPDARRARLLQGELLLRLGKKVDADDALMTIIQDFNDKKITTKDAEGMALVGRAAHLLRSKRDANEAFDDAERAGNKTVELKLWRAALFLEAYNYGRAEEAVRDALKIAPDNAASHITMAHVKLEQALDFDAAEQEVNLALAVDKVQPDAFFIRAGSALRDMELTQADKHLDEGLALDAKNLELLSMKAAVRFLSDDKPGFKKGVETVLNLNQNYARVYDIIAEYADWEHRYGEIVEMMKEATKIDPVEGKSWITLGLNQIRLGLDDDGIKSLDIGFRKDKFNVRAFNTLNLFEETIPKEYESVSTSTFRIRYPKDEKKVVERYLPQLLDDAWKSMVQRYGFTPTKPISIELYGKREHFSVRTTGLPNIGIQGVCFGQSLASMSPKSEPFNWGNVVWHELGHVFAIQLSKNHVPRWFTEGLSEYETIARRPEWQRQEDIPLYLALRHGKIPSIERFNTAFTHADDVADITMAYYAASQISVFLVEKYKMDKLNAMLRAWGEGKRTPEVIQSVLGISASELDKQFRDWLTNNRLAIYFKQYVPDLKAPELEVAQKKAKDSPNDARAQVELALASLGEGDSAAAKSALEAAEKIDAKNADVRFIRAKLAFGKKELDEAKKQLETMITEGHDGYSVRMMLGDLHEARKDLAGAAKQYEEAAKLDPRQSEPVAALVDIAKKANDVDRELKFLRILAPLEQHDHRVWRRLLGRLVQKQQWDEAVKVGESAMYVDVHSADTHTLYAQALLGAQKYDNAIFEAESALLCEKLKADVASRANVVLARAYLAKKDNTKAKAARDEALRQDPTNDEAKSLNIP